MNLPNMKTILKAVSLFILITIGLSACAYEKIKPWHRDVLSKPQNQLIPDPLEYEVDDHIYFSKEAASGGQGIGGGGCGCN